MRADVLLLPLLVLLVHASWAYPITELTAADYKTTLDSVPTALVFFDASYCSECGDLRRILSDAGDQLRDRGLEVPIFVANLEKDESLKDLSGAKGVPTVSIVRNGVRSNYRGLRATADQVAHYLEIQSGPSVRPLTSLAELGRWEASPHTLHLVVAAFGAGEDAPRAAFASLADKLKEDFVFFSVDRAAAEPGLLAHYGMTAASSAGRAELVVFKSWDPASPARLPADAAWEPAALEAFIRQHSFPDFPVIGKRWMKFIVGAEKPIVRVVLPIDSDDDVHIKEPSALVAEAMEVARRARAAINKDDQLIWAWAPKSTHGYLMNPMGYGDLERGLLVNKFGETEKYVFHYDWTVDTLATWVDDYLSKRIRPWYKSEKVPENPTVGGVTTLVGSTVHDVALDPNKDVLLEFYAPWCGHCKKLAPIWDELGKKFENVDSVVIAKMDATANEWDREKFPVTGYPTIYFVPGGKFNGRIEKYQYARDMDTFVKYLDQMKGTNWSLADTEVKKKKKKKKKDSKATQEQKDGGDKSDL